MFEFLSELSERTESPKSSIGRPSRWRRLLPPAAGCARAGVAHGRHLAEVHEVLEVDLGQRGRVGDRVFRRDGAVGLDLDREPVVVGALADAGLGHREVGAADRIVDRVDAHQVHRQRPVGRMHLGLDVAAALVHVQLHGDLAVVLEREQEVVGVLDGDGAVLLDVAGVHRARALAADVEDRVVHVLGEHQGERLEPLHDLVDVLEHALHGLVLVHHAVEAEAPDRAAAQRGQEQAAKRVAQRVAEATLQRLEAELGGIGVVVPLRHLDEMRAHQPGQINGHGHRQSRVLRPAASWAGGSRCAGSA